MQNRPFYPAKYSTRCKAIKTPQSSEYQGKPRKVQRCKKGAFLLQNAPVQGVGAKVHSPYMGGIHFCTIQQAIRHGLKSNQNHVHSTRSNFCLSLLGIGVLPTPKSPNPLEKSLKRQRSGRREWCALCLQLQGLWDRRKTKPLLAVPCRQIGPLLSWCRE